jgi:pimeloyl-ACP methyl ester carboxylesterase
VGAGAATDVAGQQNWGNQNARDAYLAYFAWARAQIDVGPVVVLGRSMGGLVASWLATRSPIAGDIAGVLFNSAVSTLFVGSGPESSPVIGRSSAAYFYTVLPGAYGVSTSNPDWYAQLQAAAAVHAPESWPASVWAGKRVLHCYGTADESVPWTPRGGAPMRALWAGQPAIDRVAIREGGDHSTTNGSYLQVPEMTAFLREIGGTPGTGAVDVRYPEYGWTGTAHASASREAVRTMAMSSGQAQWTIGGTGPGIVRVRRYEAWS